MTSEEYANVFLKNSAKMSKYGNAISELRAIGFEEVLRRLGEPSYVPLALKDHLQVSAFSQAEARGWFQALDFIFDFAEVMGRKDEREPSAGDYGAREMLEGLGYKDKEIEDAR